MPAALTRLEDWKKRLIDLVNEQRRVPFVYGRSDCGCFARAAVKAVTGVELLPGVEMPKGFIGVARFMIDRGWADMEVVMADLVGPSVEPSQSRPGDVVSFEEGEEFHLAVRVGDTALTPAGPGLIPIEPNRWRRAWRVG